MATGGGSSEELLPRGYNGGLDQLRRLIEGRESAMPRVGELFGEYRIEQKLGFGGMGIVFRATRVVDGKCVALKVPRLDHADSDMLSHRLANESAALRGLAHPNIARLLDAGVVDGVTYMATEFVEGPNLLEWARKIEPDAGQIMRMAERLAGALAVCHDAGVVHRDLSPSNVIVDAAGQPVLLDFGLGVDLEHDQPYAGLTKSGHIAGKDGYLPPEAWGSETNEPRAEPTRRWDVHGFGGCLYAMWTRREFDRSQLPELLPIPGAPNDDATRKLKLIARKCLAKRPEHRFADARQILVALGQALNPPPKSRTLLLVGAACALILGLFALSQFVGASDTPAGSPIRMWSHVLHGGLIVLFFGRSVWVRRRGEHRLELSRFMPLVWLSFLAYYTFNMIVAGLEMQTPWLQVGDAAISNATGACCLLAFCALWFPTRLATMRVFAWIAGIWTMLLLVSIGVAWSGAHILELVQFPSSLFVGASICILAIGLGQRTLRVPLVALVVLVLYGLVQLLYPAFQYIESRNEAWLIAVYGLGMIGKLALFLAVESTLRSWSLFGYEGQHSDQW